MAAYKIQFFFESHQEATIGAGASLGWSEVWYWDASNKTLQQVIDAPEIGAYLQHRLPCLSNRYRISFLRVSDEAAPRRFKIANLGFLGTADPGDPPRWGQVQCAVLVNFEKLPDPAQATEKVHARRFLMRGLPVDVINGDVINDGGVNWPAFNRFFLHMAGKPARGLRPAGLPPQSPFGCKYLHPATVKHIILKIETVPKPGKTVKITTVNFAPAVGDKVVVTGVDTDPRFNRTWTVVGAPVLVGGAQEFIAGTSRRAFDDLYDGPGPGKTYKPTFGYGPFDQFAIIGLRNRQTGRVFRQLRGRSRGG